MTTAIASANKLNLTAWALLLVLGLLWGGSFFFARVAVAEVPPFTLVLMRLSIAALALHIYLHGRHGLYAALAARWRQFLLLGLINNALPHTFIFMGQTEIGAGLASILNATTPIWTVVIAQFLTSDEKLTGAKIAGCALGFAGTVALIGPSAFETSDIPLWALALPLGAAISYGFASIYSRSFRDLNSTVTATGQLTASSIIMLPVSLLADHPWALDAPSLAATGSILALALASTAFAYILFFRLIGLAGATNTSLVTLLVPPSAILLGALFLGERLSAGDWTGMALIGAGLIVLDGRLVRTYSRTA